MQLHQLRISNFQSFGPDTTTIDLEDITFLIGPNGAGKTAVLQALSRMFAFDPSLRRVKQSDFHVPLSEETEDMPAERLLWIEAGFIFPELEGSDTTYDTIPPNFRHMRISDEGDELAIRIRLDATLHRDGEIVVGLNYILTCDESGTPVDKHPVLKGDRDNIQLHYLPARRDPSEHISYTANALLGRALRSINWKNEQESVDTLTGQIDDLLRKNRGVELLGKQLGNIWERLHKGDFFTSPQVTFGQKKIEALLKHLSVSFAPGHGDVSVDFSRLSDGQKSMLYLSLVLSMQDIGRKVLSGKITSFDVERLRPPVFTMIAMEEPENSLSPHFLGRIVKALTELGEKNDAQALIATHAPSMLKRVPPKAIRYLRLSSARKSTVTKIVMPNSKTEAHKFVSEALQAYPELYFSRFVILGEGASEEIVLPRLLSAKGLGLDEMAISVVPLGGRHVNHFWRLLSSLEIPYITLLDLDIARYEGGWGRIRYAVGELLKFPPRGYAETKESRNNLPKWYEDFELKFESHSQNWLAHLESYGVFFSYPMDLDFSMLKAYPLPYKIADKDKILPDEDCQRAVLGESKKLINQYTDDEKKLFITYKKRFKSGSKPAWHIDALSQIEDQDLVSNMPDSWSRMFDTVIQRIPDIPE